MNFSVKFWFRFRLFSTMYYMCILFDRKYPKCPNDYLSNMSAQAQKFGISMKKRHHWASVVVSFDLCISYVNFVAFSEYMNFKIQNFYFESSFFQFEIVGFLSVKDSGKINSSRFHFALLKDK